MSVPMPALPPVRRTAGPRAAGCLLAACSVALTWASPAASRAQHRTVLSHQESPLPDVPYGPETVATVVSPDGSRSVAVVKAGDEVAVFDGHSVVPYQAVAAGSPIVSADGKHCAYAARREDAGLGETFWYFSFDGNEQGPYFIIQPHSLAFRPDGLFAACVVGRRDGKEAVCVRSQEPAAQAPEAPAPAAPTVPAPAPRAPDRPGGLPSPGEPVHPPAAVRTEMGRWFDRVGDQAPRFSPDGSYLAYAASYEQRWHVLLNGVEGSAYESVGRPRFCPSGAVLGYVGRREGKAVAVTLPVGVFGAAGTEGPAYAEIRENSLTFSFDGNSIAYVVGRPGAMRVIDSRPADPANAAPAPGAVAAPGPVPGPAGAAGAAAALSFEAVAEDSLVFSADGKHLAFAASRGGQWFVVRDQTDGPGFVGLGGGPPAFSTDGKRLAYVAERVVPAGGGRREHLERFAVVDGVAQKPYDRIPTPPVFSADGKRCAYVAERGTSCFVVIDGLEGKSYRCIRGRPTLSPDGSLCAFTALPADTDGRFSAAEEVPRDPSDPDAGSRLLFDRVPGFWHMSDTMRNPVKMLMVEERIVEE